MTLRHWCLSWRGRLGRRDFWLWLVVWALLMMLLFNLAGNGRIERRTAALLVLLLLWPMAAVMVKRLHDRNKGGQWALLFIVVWVLLNADLSLLPLQWQVFLGFFIPTLIILTMLVELGALPGTSGANRFGKAAQPVVFFGRRREPNYQ
ncbi:hypothetical protein BL250_11380 [Erwinia sp. OLTSP20]|uniref:DUF805 domain-containing protein n=1 Tax=unclassified Erwinia TaxID=2622719 RepID=UPI000C196F93|nr:MULTISPECIES: DUF805 domain-containing protein [unclassified Erwinia]PIJ49930.1 hypothetical protein BV501_10795 [Erwinia sp. OAMSP11]PIJ71453.1 hypothetical protein BK416_11500 [Erwinia sp. OLSSP12]PIJ80888.1 hypothetical protein BLD47_10395 [Erwinia sp. OLCASP19]PIJ83367.1 hypothetical protein BLD46_09790 [Erwinia sp. OLMTSP26]PIJ85589.1 hypothetical protein BLD49_10340 [Erwinia sp. OLMDSP33]